MKGLIIKSPWIDLIFDHKKTWEIRGSNTSIRGKILLIKSGTGLIYGTVDLIGSKQLTVEEYQSSESFHCISDISEIPYKNVFAWILANPRLFNEPIPYKHPQGAVIWVNIESEM